MSLSPLQQPNIIILMSDQQRALRHFPADWVAQNLPNFARLQATGITFRNAITNTCRCSPSRATLFTSTYPAVNGVLQVGDALPANFTTLGTVLAAAGYEVVYKGKWHLSRDFDAVSTRQRPIAAEVLDGEDRTMSENWDMTGWTAPDAGTKLQTTVGSGLQATLNTLGAGSPAQNDARVVSGPSSTTAQETVLEFLADHQNPVQPFCLIVSLVNPHDVFVYPTLLSSTSYDSTYAGYEGFNLPASYADDLSTKPAAQSTYLEHFGGGPLPAAEALEYVKFYAYLHTLVDAQIGAILDALPASLLANTLIVQLADHGEMAMAHGGLREKDNNAYRETLNVPLVFSNPTLANACWSQQNWSDALVGLVDVLPTLASIAGLTPDQVAGYQLQGRDFSPTLLEPTTPTQDAVLFTFDDGSYACLNHIRCLLQSRDGVPAWKYAVYYGPESNPDTPGDYEYEMYDLLADPDERQNLLYGALSPDVQNRHIQLHRALTNLMSTTRTTPSNWPSNPPNPAAGTRVAEAGCNPVRAVTPGEWPSFSNDGSRIVYTRGNSLYVIDRDGGQPTCLVAGGATSRASRPDWSWSEEAIAYTWETLDAQGRTLSAEIYTVNSDGSGAAPLTNEGTLKQTYYPSWYQSLDRIVAMDATGGMQKVELWIFPINGDSVIQLTSAATVVAGRPSVSPDGSRVAFAGRLPGSGTQDENQIWVATDLQTTPVQLDPAQGRSPNWSPDGQWIVFESNRNGGVYQIYVMAADGSGATAITDSSQQATHPEWSRDQKRIVFQGARTGVSVIATPSQYLPVSRAG